ncbi:BST1 [Candida oxycetoniae]|uniref:GPI inositol-deacylase n=1 Tax=Candida oxycetoniae TaxID=497107 RepID=A0AAI9T253_9ASCO|nr:BST1 [Candida oxycetoniae]KAI3407064.2 BST1 [Candida oxycetoniae]
MYPSYARIKSFDESYTSYAKKYSFYLYREQGKDKLPKDDDGSIDLEGVPVLFIPGNAGSFRQVRSIASRAADLYYHERKEEEEEGGKLPGLDFFTIDFNEDFTAFHGRTILDQAEFANEVVKFIIGLYKKRQNQKDTAPKSVILIGHSMGGIVSRIMLTLPNYQQDSIETIITLSSPHSASPLTFDGDLIKIYSAVDKFWQLGFSTNKELSSSKKVDEIAHERLANIALVSITGGALDFTLPADYTTLGYIVPESNGFTSFTTGIPLVWTPIDHLAIVWCQQLRTRIAYALLDIVHLERNEKENWLTQRMNVFKSYFLSGFEQYVHENQVLEKRHRLRSSGQVLKLNKRYTRGKELGKRSIFQWEKNGNKEIHFSLLSSVPIKEGGFSIQLCLTDNTDEEQQRLFCSSMESRQNIVPNFSKGVNDISDSSYNGDKQPFYSVELDSELLKMYNCIIIENVEDTQFISMELSTFETKYTMRGNTFSMLTTGNSIKLPFNRPQMIDLSIPQAWNSLLVYKAHFEGCLEGVQYNPFIRQYTQEPFESKWFLNVRESIELTMHGIAPYVPYNNTHDNHAMNLQIWSSNCDKREELKLFIQVDYLSSLKLLILRYRLTIIAFNIGICALVLSLQFYQVEKMPSFWHTLIYLNSNWWWLIALVLMFFNVLVNMPGIKQLLLTCNPALLQVGKSPALKGSVFDVNLLYLGLKESFTVVGIILYFVSSFVVAMSYFALILIGECINFVRNLDLFKLRFFKANPHVMMTTRTKTRTTTCLQMFIIFLVLILISFYIPYQIVYLLSCFIQVINVLKDWPGKNNTHSTISNYQISWLMMMLWILPINVPILIVFIHNLAVNWKTPFSSHHNVLSILPILILVKYNGSIREMKAGDKKVELMVKLSMKYLWIFAFVYGSRYTFFIHHLFNLLSFLVLVYLGGSLSIGGM